jgi:hypothetical protein
MSNKESSLTAPADRDRKNRWRPEIGVESLNTTEANEAMKELNVTSFTEKFPRVDRTYADPPISLQNFGLISFIPASGAKPNENGVFGFAKLRGNYQTQIEAAQRAEFLVRNVDSYHKIFHTYVGRPFPITCSSDYSENTDEIDIRKEMANTISKDIRKKKMEEQGTVKDMKEREKALLEESKREDIDPYEHYITQRVKKAQLSWTYLEHIKKLEEVKKSIVSAHNEIITLEKENPKYKDTYYQKYLDARKDAGIKDTKETKNSFLKFMVEDAELPGLELVANKFFDEKDLE